MRTPAKTKDLAALLHDADLRATPQRLLLLSLLRKHTKPVSVEDLLKEGRGKFDMTTAYRTLETLLRHGIVRRVGLDQERALFEMADDHHHHAICVSCGVIRDVSACVSPALDEKVCKAVRFERIDSHALEFFGVCAACASGSPRKRR